jgi:hypothetical protein
MTTFHLLPLLLDSEQLSATSAWELGQSEKYVSNSIFKAKEENGSFVVYLEKDKKRTKLETLSKFEFKKKYVKASLTSSPDVEGFLTYVSKNDVEAFQYEGDPVKVKTTKTTYTMNSGDYLVSITKGGAKMYSVMSEDEFESLFVKK